MTAAQIIALLIMFGIFVWMLKVMCKYERDITRVELENAELRNDKTMLECEVKALQNDVSEARKWRQVIR